MKAAIYIEDGVFQVALTPENDFEKNILKALDAHKTVEIHKGGFYPCVGGWNRHASTPAEHESVMIRLVNKKHENLKGNAPTPDNHDNLA